MEIIGEGLIAIGHAVGAFAWATALVYVTALVTKTVLIINGDAKPEELKDWMNLNLWKKKNKNGF